MKTRITTICILVVMIISTNSTLAQLPSLPVYFKPMHEVFPNYSLSFDYGIGARGLEEREFLGGRASLEGDRWRISLGAGSVVPSKGENKLAIASNFAYSLSNQNTTLILLAAQIGFGFFEIGNSATGKVQQWNIPIGIGIGLNGRIPDRKLCNIISLTNFGPWVALRCHTRFSESKNLPQNFDKWKGGAGLSHGWIFRFPNGFGIHAAVDWLIIEGPNEVTVGFGINWSS